MYAVSRGYHDAMQADMRQVLAKVVIDYTNPFIDQSISVVASCNARISWPDQVADGVKTIPHLWAQLDGTWTAGQARRLMPDTPEMAALYQTGWYGQYPADEAGNLGAPYTDTPALTVTHFPRPIHTLRVVGEPLCGEYPVDFVIKLYAGDVLLHTETVTANDRVEWGKTLDTPLLDVTRQELYLQIWSAPNQLPKIVEFFSSVQQTYEADGLLSLRVLEEQESSLGSLPVGSASAGEIRVALSNKDRRFDADNDTSPLYRLVKPRRRIRAWLGAEVGDQLEWVPMGTYWATEWDTNDDSLEVIVTGLDRLELLRQSDYVTCVPQQDVSLYDLAEHVLIDAGLRSNEYEIDEALQALIVPWGYIGPMSHREALRVVAEAALAVVYVDRDGKVRVRIPDNVVPGTPETYYLQAAFPAEVVDSGLYAIGPDDYYPSIRTPSRQNLLANEILVTTRPLVLEDTQEVYRSTEPVMVAAGKSVMVTIRYSKSPALNVTLSLDNPPPGVSIDSSTLYAWGADVTIKNTGGADETAIITATGQPLVAQGGVQVMQQDEISATENGLLRYRYPDNPLVQTVARATAIAQAILVASKDSKRDIEFDWRGNPALELGDAIHVVTDAKREQRSNYTIVQQELTWNGALRAHLSGRRLS